MSSFVQGRGLKGWHQSPMAFSAMAGICFSFTPTSRRREGNPMDEERRATPTQACSAA